jgi:tetratricopeptide (TPR) repeat protein
MIDPLESVFQSAPGRDAAGPSAGVYATALVGAFILPILGVLWLAGTTAQAWSGMWRGLLCALAPLALGWSVGFLFGLPQIQKVSTGQTASGDTSYAPGGHLEAISDWLTKIIVGVSLVQWNSFMAKFWAIAGAMSSTFDPRNGTMVAACALVYFGLLGLMGGYLTTRLNLANLMARADRQLNRPDPSDVERVGRTQIDQSTGTLDNPDPSASASLAAFPMSSFTTPKALSAWAKAKLFLGDRPSAITALEKAIDLDPKDPTLRRELAALVKPQDAARANQLLEDAAKIQEDPTRLASRMLVALYKAPPTGFTDVIATLESRILDPHYKEVADLHAYLCCAYGQKADYQLEKGEIAKASPEFANLKARALEQAGQAIQLDGAKWKGMLAAFLAPPPGATDDDLRVFGDDPDFRSLVK